MDKINYTFMMCEDFQKYMNTQKIEFGQPYINESKRARLLPLEERSHFVVYANPKLAGFRPEMHRYFLPKGLDQILDFLVSKGIHSTVVRDKLGYQIKGSVRSYKDTWRQWAADALTRLKKEKLIK